MSGLIEAARAAAARGLSYGVRQFGRVRGSRRLRNWLIPPTTRRAAGWPALRAGRRLALAPVPSVTRPVVPPRRQGTSRPEAASIWWSYPVPATLDSTVFGAPVSQLHSWPRRVFILTAAVATLMCGAATGFGQCCGPGCGAGCGSGCGIGPSMCSSGPGCCCPPGGCGFGCSAGCGCPRAPFGFGFFGGPRCGPPCGSCCGPACGGFCGGGCGPVCGPRCGSVCGSPCGAGPCGCAPYGGGYCGGPACGLACGPCAPGACGSGCCGSCAPSCAGAPGPCGAGCCPTPTYETTPAMPPGTTDRPGYPPAIGPGEPIPGAAPTTIPKRSTAPPDDKGTRFERRPPESSGTAATVPVTDSSDPTGDPPSQSTKRLFRQSLSAGFHTRILTVQSERSIAMNRAAHPSPFTAEPDDELARRE